MGESMIDFVTWSKLKKLAAGGQTPGNPGSSGPSAAAINELKEQVEAKITVNKNSIAETNTKLITLTEKVDKNKEKADENSTKINTVSGEVEATKTSVNDTKAKLNLLVNTVEENKNSTATTINEKVFELDNKITAERKKIETNQQALTEANEKMERISAEHTRSVKETDNKLQELETKVEQSKTTAEEAKNALTPVKTLADSNKEKISALEAKDTVLQKLIDTTKEEVDKKVSKEQLADAQRDNGRELTNLRKDNDRLSERVGTTEKDLKNLKAKVNPNYVLNSANQYIMPFDRDFELFLENAIEGHDPLNNLTIEIPFFKGRLYKDRYTVKKDAKTETTVLRLRDPNSWERIDQCPIEIKNLGKDLEDSSKIPQEINMCFCMSDGQLNVSGEYAKIIDDIRKEFFTNGKKLNTLGIGKLSGVEFGECGDHLFFENFMEKGDRYNERTCLYANYKNDDLNSLPVGTKGIIEMEGQADVNILVYKVYPEQKAISFMYERASGSDLDSRENSVKSFIYNGRKYELENVRAKNSNPFYDDVLEKIDFAAYQKAIFKAAAGVTSREEIDIFGIMLHPEIGISGYVTEAELETECTKIVKNLTNFIKMIKAENPKVDVVIFSPILPATNGEDRPAYLPIRRKIMRLCTKIYHMINEHFYSGGVTYVDIKSMINSNYAMQGELRQKHGFTQEKEWVSQDYVLSEETLKFFRMLMITNLLNIMMRKKP